MGQESHVKDCGYLAARLDELLDIKPMTGGGEIKFLDKSEGEGMPW